MSRHARAGAELRISAVVVTAGRPEWLRRCVESLRAAASAAGDSVALKICVAVNGDPASVAAAHALIDASTVVRALEKTSPAEARNRVLAELGDQADWVLFVDDDAFVPSRYFEAFHRALDQFPDAVAFGGPNLTPEVTGVFQRATGVSLSSRFATFLSHARYRARGVTRLSGEESLILCNMLVKRESLGVSPFPADFVCNEENWLLQELRARNERVVHAPELFVWHERRAGIARLAKQVFRYGIGRGQNLRRRPSSFRIAHVVPTSCLLYAAAAIPLDGRFVAVPLAAYAALAVLAAVKATLSCRENPIVIPLVALLFPVVHACYGAGLIFGLVRGGQRAA